MIKDGKLIFKIEQIAIAPPDSVQARMRASIDPTWANLVRI